MKFCTKCGKELLDEAVICTNCGCAVGGANGLYKIANQNDAPSAGFAVLGFFIPIVGFILYLVFNDSTPLKAKSAGKGALAGFITSIVLSISYIMLLILS